MKPFTCFSLFGANGQQNDGNQDDSNNGGAFADNYYGISEIPEPGSDGKQQNKHTGNVNDISGENQINQQTTSYETIGFERSQIRIF
jgi:hypothetical protein